jgi:hypothetical protein
MGVKVTRLYFKRTPTLEELATVTARLQERSVKNQKTQCVEWKGTKNELGYGHTSFQGQPWMAHRLVWALSNGRIPEGLFVLHNCDNPSCINAAHLRVGTHDENMKECVRKKRHYKNRKTECLRGHPLDEENTLVTINECGGPRRACKTCSRIRQRIASGWTREEAEACEAPIPMGAITARRDFKFSKRLGNSAGNDGQA